MASLSLKRFGPTAAPFGRSRAWCLVHAKASGWWAMPTLRKAFDSNIVGWASPTFDSREFSVDQALVIGIGPIEQSFQMLGTDAAVVQGRADKRGGCPSPLDFGELPHGGKPPSHGQLEPGPP